MNATDKLTVAHLPFQLRQFLDCIQAPVWLIQSDGPMEYCNEHWLMYTGVDPASAFELGWRSAIYPDDLAQLDSAWRSSELAAVLKVRIRRFDGEYRWFLLQSSAIRRAREEPERWCIVGTDIDQLERATALASSLERVWAIVADGETLNSIFTALCEIVDDQISNTISVFSLFGKSGGVSHVSRRPIAAAIVEATDHKAFGALGPRSATLTAANLVENLPLDPTFIDIRDLVMNSGLNAVLLTPLQSKSGTHVGAIYTYFVAGKYANEAIITLVKKCADIAIAAIERKHRRSRTLKTETDRINTQLLESNNYLRQIFDSIPTQVWCAFDSTKTEFQNKRWLDYVGLSAEETKGAGWEKCVHPDDAPGYLAKWAEISASGRAGQAEARFRRHDGVYRWFLMQTEPLRDSNGAVVRWYGANTDIEDLKREQEALKDAQFELARTVRLSSIGEFATSIAHEVNQPLSAIVTNAQAIQSWLSQDRPDYQEVRLAVADIAEGGQRASRIISGIHTLAKRGAPEIVKFKLEPAVHEILNLLQGEIRRNGIAVEESFGDVPPIVGDRVQIQQVVLNLVRNGIEAMSSVDRSRRVLIISFETEIDGMVTITVADAGEGIDPAIVDRIFETFFSTKCEGMGMGLSICRRIADAHGGKIWTVPNIPHGTVFRFSLPATDKR